MFDEILRRIADVEDQVRTATRLGTVTAVDGTDRSLTVEVAGQAIGGVRWGVAFASGTTNPEVGDFVVILRTGEAWTCLVKLSMDLTGPGYIEQTVRVPAKQMAYALYEGEWNWYSSTALIQGREPGFDDPGMAGLALFDPLAGVIPDGATVSAAKLRMRRVDTQGASLVSPHVRGHARTTIPGTATPSSVWSSGYGPWVPGSLQKGQVGSWDLPSSWLTAWLAGTITGIGIEGYTLALYARFSEVWLDLTVRIPA